MEKEIRALQTELATLKSQLSRNNAMKDEKTVKSVKTEIEEEFPTKVTMETDPDQDGRIIDILKLMDEENALKQKRVAEELESKREAEAKFVASEKAKLEVAERAISDAAEAENGRAGKEEEKKKIVSKTAVVTSAPNIERKEVNKGSDVSKPKSEVAKKASTKKATKGATEILSDAPKKPTTKLSTKKTSKTATSSNADDWATLAESTLKRKSVAQLTEYLVGRVSSISR
jgi:hypothetical protein